jgi:AraC-like DNA-binding protein
MKPVLEYLPKNGGESFVVKFFDYDYYPTPWHFHPEYELVLVTESTGTRFIGDQVTRYQPGDLAFIGPNIPHTYKSDAVYYNGEGLRAKSIVIHFLPSAFGEFFFSIPETNSLKGLFIKAASGMDITGTINDQVSRCMHELVQLNNLARWIKLLEILNLLAESAEYSLICGGKVTGINEKESDRMDQVLNFILKNFNNNIGLKDASNVANMSENSFSRYFGLRTRRTFVSFVNEVRLSHASKLLIENKLSVADISLSCGFNNLSNFNKQFKKFYSVSPSVYQKKYVFK